MDGLPNAVNLYASKYRNQQGNYQNNTENLCIKID